MSLDQKASVFEIVVLNGILWRAMRPVEDQYDAQKMQAAAAAVTALREQGQLSRGQEGTDTAMSTLDFATAMIMLVAPVDFPHVSAQCELLREAQNLPAGAPRGNVGMLLAIAPWFTICNTYVTSMLKEKEYAAQKCGFMLSLTATSSDAVAAPGVCLLYTSDAADE